MSFFDDLKKKALGIVAQVNPLDHGATYNTTVNAPKFQTPQVQTPHFQAPQQQQQQQPTIRPLQTPSFNTPKISTPSIPQPHGGGFNLGSFGHALTHNPLTNLPHTLNNDIAKPVQRAAHSVQHQAQGVVAQVNPADAGRTYHTVMDKGAQYAPRPNASVTHQLTHNGLTNGAGGFAKGIANMSGIPSAVDAGRLGAAEITHNQPAIDSATTRLAHNLPQFLPVAAATGFKNLATPVVQATLSPIAENYANKEADRARQELSMPDAGPAYNAAVEAYANAVKTDNLTSYLDKAGIGMNTPTSQVAKQVAGQMYGGAADALLAGKMGVATTPAKILSKVGIQKTKGNAVKEGLKEWGPLGALSAAGNTAANPNSTNADIISAGLLGYGMNAGLPIALHGAGKGIQLAQDLGVPRPSNLTDQELVHLQNFNNTARSGALMDEQTYRGGVAAAQKAGLSYNDPAAIDQLLGAHRSYDTAVQQRAQSLQAAKQRLAPTSEIGAVGKNVKGEPNPLAALKQEALKYKSANEFTKALTTNKVAIPNFDAKEVAKMQTEKLGITQADRQNPQMYDGITHAQKKMVDTIYNQAHTEAKTSGQLVYHGSNKPLSKLTKSSGALRGQPFYGDGVYVTKDLANAQKYADSSVKMAGTGSPTISEFYANVKKPFVIDENTNLEAVRKMVGSDIPVNKLEGKTNADKIMWYTHHNPQAFTEGLKKLGYDGIEVTARPGEHELIAFDESQIAPKPTEAKGVAPQVGKTGPMQQVFAENPMNPENAVRLPRSSSAPVSGGVPQVKEILPTAAELESRVRLESGKAVPNDSSSASSPLPVYNTKQVGKLDKAFRSTRGIIDRQGEEGKQLAGMLQGARDNQELHLAQIQKQMPTVTKLAHDKTFSLNNKDFENFVDATQGLAKPKNDTIAKAVSEWQATHPQIRDRAVNAGLDVGNLGPTYYPHLIDYQALFKDTNTYNKAINHLVDTGQAKTREEAIKLLDYAKDVSRNRAFGNLESSRLVDLPFYDKTPNSLISYLNGSTKRIAQTETFGAGDEKALKLISDAGVKGYDTEAMKNAYDIAVGAKQYSPTASGVSGAIRKYVTTTRLGLGALTNVSQNVNTGIVTGHLRTLGAVVKQLDPKTRSFVGDTGVIADAVLSDLKTQTGYSSFSSKVFGKVVNKITAPGFGAVEKMNRSVAATAGRDYALRLAQKGDATTLRRLGVTGEIKGKTLTEAQQIQAARKVVEKTQFKVDAQDLPGWADSPGGKLVSQFRTFSYKQGQFMSNEILKPAAHGDLMPLGRFLTALPLGFALYEAKRGIAGRPEEENKSKIGLQTAQNIGGFGLVFDMYQSLNPLGSKYIPSDRRSSMTFGAFGGPSLGVAAQGAGALSDLIQRKNTPTDESRLQGKLALGKTTDSYTDATPAARFALQQLPVVGTGIKNRLLPFTTESNADAGKLTPSANNSSVKTSPRMTPAQAVAAGFTTAEDKKFLALSPADQKALASSDPNARALYDEINATKTAFQAPGLHSFGISPESAHVLDKYNNLTQAGKNKFDANFDNTYNLKMAQFEDAQKSGDKTGDALYNAQRSLLPYQLAKQAGAKSSQDFKDYQESPLGIFQTMDQQYQLDKANNKISPIDDYQMQDKLYKAQVQAPFSKQAVDIMGMSEKRILDFIDNGSVSKDQLKELQALDQANLDAGVYKYSKLDGASGKGGKRSGGGSKEALSVKIAKAQASLPTPPSYKFDAGSHFKSLKVSTRSKRHGTKVRTVSRNPKVKVT